MRAVVQRVLEASVVVATKTVGAIDRGLLVFVGVANDDGPEDVDYIATKVSGLRIFDDDNGRMNVSVGDVGGAVLLVSQFTLHADARKGRRPSFDAAAPAEVASSLYAAVAARLRAIGLRVEEGRFQALMRVRLVNDGPVTILLDSRRGF